MEILFALIIGFVLDFLFGDPKNLYHSVQFIGMLINICEKILRKIFPKTHKGEIIAGSFLVFIICTLSFIIPYIILLIVGFINPILRVLIQGIFCWQSLALKSLKDAAMNVFSLLNKDDLNGAREAVGWIVGRDTKNLDEKEISRATVETVAENTSDGIIAPMLFFTIGGAPLAFLYKGINTMDSMVAYKNDKYLYFGRAAAIVDDIANYIPARITSLFMILGAFIVKLDYKNANIIYKRDKNNHPSPNSAHPEAVCAGALGIQLGGDSFYGGKLVTKKTIGDPINEITRSDIPRSCKLTTTATIICFCICLICRSVVVFKGMGNIF